MSGGEAPQLSPPPGMYGADGQRMNVPPRPGSLFDMLGNGAGMMQMFQQQQKPAPGLGGIDQRNLSGVFGESDPMGTMPSPTATAGMDPKMLQLMLSMRGMGGNGQQPMQMPAAAPGPQIQPGALMGAMPGQPQGGFRPRGMAGRF